MAPLFGISKRPGQAGTRRLPAFSSAEADDWVPWRGIYRNARVSHGWADDVARNQLAQAMEGLAQTRVGHINAHGIDPDTGVAYTADGLLAKYDAIFLPAAGSHYARMEFKQAKQKAGETVAAWHARLRYIFLRAEPGADTETSRDLMETFVLGLEDPSVRSYTFRDFPATYELALHRATMQAAAEQVLDPKGKSNNIFSIDAPTERDLAFTGRAKKTERGRQVEIERVMPNRDMNDGRCFRCDQPGHIRADCRVNLNRQERERRGVRAVEKFGNSRRNFSGRSRNQRNPGRTTNTSSTQRGKLTVSELRQQINTLTEALEEAHAAEDTAQMEVDMAAREMEEGN